MRGKKAPSMIKTWITWWFEWFAAWGRIFGLFIAQFKVGGHLVLLLRSLGRSGTGPRLIGRGDRSRVRVGKNVAWHATWGSKDSAKKKVENHKDYHQDSRKKVFFSGRLDGNWPWRLSKAIIPFHHHYFQIKVSLSFHIGHLKKGALRHFISQLIQYKMFDNRPKTSHLQGGNK